MRNMTWAVLRCAVVAVAVVVLAPAASGASEPRALDPATRFYVPAPSADAVRQGIDLLRQRNFKGVLQLAAMIAQGHAVWVTGGTPVEAEKQVRKVMQSAAFQRRVPVLVAYNLPYRDCLQYSAGGAPTTADYIAWIDGFAKGIGSGKAVVILEPDGLGIIPYNVDLQGVHEWCQPPGGSSALADARYVELNAAVDRLAQQPRASVYLDGTHSNWLGSGEAAYRLHKAGVLRTQGFFVNASNYQPTPQLVQYGTWISKCIAFATSRASLGGRALRLVRQPVLPRDLERLLDVAPDGREVRGGGRPEHRRRRADALRGRHEPQRAGAVAPDGVVPGRPGLVQPAGPRARSASDGEHGCAARARPAARRCVSLDQGPRRVGRLLQPRDRRLDDRSGVGDGRPAGGSLVPATGAPARAAREPAAPRLIDSSQDSSGGTARAAPPEAGSTIGRHGGGGQIADIREVARRSGVSIATVSRVLNGTAKVSDEARERVLAQAAALEYVPSAAARTLVTRRSQILGIVLNTGADHPDIGHPFFQDVLTGLKHAAGELGYDLLVFAAYRPKEFLRRALHHRVDGLILMGVDRA